jgi:hypothetical protein
MKNEKTMTSRAELLALKRQMLVAECALQREDLFHQALPLAYTLHSAETGARIVGRVVKHPGWIAAMAAGLLIIRPRRLSAMLRMGTKSVRTWRQLAPVVQKLMAGGGFGL